MLKGREKHWLTALAFSSGRELYKRSISYSRHSWQAFSVLNAILGACTVKELLGVTGAVKVITTT
tara:strand:+ start:62 stop:256 length:195 start_codon:yes stop_codon:yes gene_type:complete